MELSNLNRNAFVNVLKTKQHWDVVIIGGGATGLGIAVDAASRGYATLLLEQSDFAKGTSSRSTKLVHGGVRYLAQGDIKLVYDALHERGLLQQNAPHLVKKQAFIIPCYSFFSKLKYLVGLKMYDWLSGRYSFGKSKILSKKEVEKLVPAINGKSLVGGVEYFDGQFDDARLAINLAQTSAEYGGVLLNYFQVTGLQKKNGMVSGVTAVDKETNENYTIHAKVVINATGVFVDDVLKMDVPEKRPLVRPSQGIHLVVDQSFLASNSALMIPKTADGRVLFAVPWHNHVLLGTTDTPLDQHSLEPVALQKEIDFILNTVKHYLAKPPAEKDVLSIFAGLRPLAAPQKETGSTKEISRDHKLLISDSGLVTITGGKWTTYRKMAEETVNKAIAVGELMPVECKTKGIRIHGWSNAVPENEMSVYGSDAAEIQSMIQRNPALGKRLLKAFAFTEAEVVWAVEKEMARTVEDVLARRLRLLFLNAEAALSIAPKVASIMALMLDKNEDWEKRQVEEFNKVADHYLIRPNNQNSEMPLVVSNALSF